MNAMPNASPLGRYGRMALGPSLLSTDMRMPNASPPATA